MSEAIIVLNAGSSSLKFGLYEAEPGRGVRRFARGRISDLQDRPLFSATGREGEPLAEGAISTGSDPYEAALDHLLAFLAERFPGTRLAAAGHRIVHGGRHYSAPVRITANVFARLEALAPLAPLHQPHNLAPVKALTKRCPDLPQIACFDTAFHRTNERLAQIFALPRALLEEGVLRYGFHGLSYEYIAGCLRETDPEHGGGRAVVAHLGNGASLCALREGVSIATTMGFTALDGLPMGTRAGSLDPGVLLYLQSAKGFDTARLTRLLYEQSGLLGLSGVSHDMRTLLASEDAHAKEAVSFFCYRIAREIGSLAAALGGLDTIVFTAGIGENAPPVRAEVCARSAWLGIALDAEANARNAETISAPASRVAVRVIPTNEELVIARATAGMLMG